MLYTLKNNTNIGTSDFESFLSDYRKLLEGLFEDSFSREELSSGWEMPEKLLSPILASGPLSTYIDKDYGGMGGGIKEGLMLLEASAYQSLPLALMVGINGALFLQPLEVYGQAEAKKQVFEDFVQNGKMGGLMITEPEFGTDALRMKTHFSKTSQGSYSVNGLKHWAGLTGLADYWIITAREKKSEDRLGKDIGFFLHNSSHPGVTVEELYKNLGLRILPYGKNRINCDIPENYRLIPKTSGIKMLTDTLHRSRLQFPGMGVGFLRRLLESGLEHCKEREVGGKSLLNYEQVQKRMFLIQSNYTVCSAMCAYTASNACTSKDLSDQTIPANSIKALVTDYMQESAQTLLQLFGSKGYTIGNVAARGMVDSRPFQIFEGSNDILYQQITESVMKNMKKMKISNVYDFLTKFELTEKASGYFKDQLSFELSHNMAQDKLVEFGKIFARIVSLQFTINLGNGGYYPGMISGAIENLCREVKGLISSYQDSVPCSVFEDIEENTNWKTCIV